MKVVGLMSGTSADGVDAALVSIVRRGGTPRITPLAFASLPYPRSLRPVAVFEDGGVLEKFPGLLYALDGRVDDTCHLNT